MIDAIGIYFHHATPGLAGAAGVAIPDDCPALSAWQARIGERDSVKHRSGQQMELPH